MNTQLKSVAWLVVVFMLAGAVVESFAAEDARETFTFPDKSGEKSFAANPVKELRAYRTDVSPSIDGRLTEPVWEKAEPAVGFSNFSQAESMTRDQTIGRVLYDDENFYFGVECLESRMDLLRKDLAEMTDQFDYVKGEVIEIFLAPEPESKDYHQFMIGANGTVVQASIDTMQIAKMPCRVAVSLADDRFFIEVAVPLSSLHLGPQTRTSWGFNFNRARLLEREAKEGPNVNCFSSWQNTGGAFNRPGRFGRLSIDLDSSRYWYDVKLLESSPDSLATAKVSIGNLTGRPVKLKAVLGFESATKKKTYTESVSLASDEENIVEFAGPFPAWTATASLSVTVNDLRTKKTVYYGGTRSVDVTPGHQGPVPQYSREDLAAGYVLFTKDYTSRVLRTYMPSLREVDSPLEIFASLGEYEPVVLGVRTFKKLSGVSVKIKDDLTSADGDRLWSDNFDLRIITETKYWTPNGKGQQFRWQPMLAESKLPDELAGEHTFSYWLTLKVPETAKAGTYSGTVAFAANGVPAKELPIEVTIWPIKLQSPPDMCWGYFYDVFRLPKYARTLAYQRKLFRALSEYGINNTTIYGGVGSDGAVDKCADPYLPILQTMNDALELGVATRGIPVITCAVGIFGQSFAEASRKNNWPEFLMYAYDEPDDPEQIAAAKKGLTGLKKDHPEVKLVTAMSENGIKALGDFYSSWIVDYESLANLEIYELMDQGRAKGKLIQTYDCRNYATNFRFNRYYSGLCSWKAKVKGNWQWALVDYQFDHRLGRPMAEVYRGNGDAVWQLYFDHPEEFNFTFNYLFPARQGPIPALGHIGRREGIDDYKYAYTLRQLINRAAAGEDHSMQKAAKAAENVLHGILSKIGITFGATEARTELDSKGISSLLGDWNPDEHIPSEDFTKFRRDIAGQILVLQNMLAR